MATLAALVWIDFPLVYWSGLIAVTSATAAAVAISEKGRWELGLFVQPRVAARELAAGSAIGFVLVGLAALLVAATTAVRHLWGGGFPWLEIVAVFLPAALHEELLFRGYPFQKIYRWNRGLAIFVFAAVFSALHGGNPGVTALALTNIFLGGVLLGLAYALHERLWFPIGLHLAWNVMSGPILGHEVSGYEPMRTLFVETGDGAWWLTGGAFGVEGSLWMTVVELIAIAVVGKRIAGAARPL